MGVIDLVGSVVITEEEQWIVATDIRTGIASQGKTNHEALYNLKEALELYDQDAFQMDEE